MSRVSPDAVDHSKLTDWDDWGNPAYPWVEFSQCLNREELDNLKQFVSQDGYLHDENRPDIALKEDLFRQRDEFRRNLYQQEIYFSQTDIIWKERIFACLLWYRGSKRMREQAIPAYAFDRFPNLPPELQIKIWSLATQTLEPQTYPLASIAHEKTISYLCGKLRSYGSGSTRVYLCNTPKPPVTLFVCKTSRSVAQKAYTLMKCKNRAAQNIFRFLDTSVDAFYMSGIHWDQYKLLVDLVLEETAKLPPPADVQRDLFNLKRINFLMVDIKVFAKAPTKIWPRLPNVKLLTIVLCPVSAIVDQNGTNSLPHTVKYKLLVPLQGSVGSIRVKWIKKKVIWLLESIQSENLEWRIPSIEVITRVRGIYHPTVEIKYQEKRAVDDQDEDEINHKENEDEDDEKELLKHYAGWFMRAKEMLVPHDLTKEELSELQSTYEVWL